MGERLNGIQEVRGSIPLASTQRHNDARADTQVQLLHVRFVW